MGLLNNLPDVVKNLLILNLLALKQQLFRKLKRIQKNYPLAVYVRHSAMENLNKLMRFLVGNGR